MLEFAERNAEQSEFPSFYRNGGICHDAWRKS